ncbi:MAG: response regulator transcription factor [Leptospiraceae bacterium]|nr:response regulator transcription factor [Leptospiraceae bacterium]
MKNLIIVDDHPIVLVGLVYSLQSSQEFKVVDKFQSPQEALQYLESNHSNVFGVMMDFDMPQMNGFELATQIKNNFPNLKTILYTFYSGVEYVNNAKNRGIDALISKDCEVTDILNILSIVSNGGSYFSSKQIKSQSEILNKMSDTQLMILNYLKKGMTAKEIALEVGKSNRTIEYHTTRLRKLFTARNNTELINKYSNIS